jgi:hypothetical protein
MMKISNLYNLSQHFSRSMGWRRKELADIKFLVNSAQFNPKTKDTIIRGAVALLYAHWEGFVKDAATAYLQFVVRQKHTYNQITSNFVALAMKAKHQKAEQTLKGEPFIVVADFFLTGLESIFKVNWDGAIETESNLKSPIFRGIILKLGLDYTQYSTKENIIDEKLLQNRNKIAHGEYQLMTVDEFIELHNEVMMLLDLFQDQIIDAARNESYLR